ncbi:hypothetical protein QJQ45_001432 [Haematococcus lacustris]|nr:hypothetical protein QJQ45_001432 [Haematococcus lacustris]
MPVPGAATLATLFDKVKLKQLSFDVSSELPLPDLQPLAQHLTQLHIGHSMSPQVPLSTYAATLGPVAQLQVLIVLQQGSLEGLTQLRRALPRLHTLQLPDTPVKGQQQLEALLAATQLTSVQLDSVQGLGSCCDDLPCAWQKLELQGGVDCSTATYLPLHSLNQPLVLGKLDISAGHDTAAQVVAAVSHLTQACKVPVKIKGLELNMYMGTTAAAAGSGPGQRTSPSAAHGSQQLVKLQELVAVLLPLASCFGEVTVYNHHGVCAECVAALAPLLQGCTCFHLVYGSLDPTLEFWRQLVQLIPTISHVTFTNSKGVASAAMSRALRQMAEQPWARWLHITIYAPSEQLPKCCKSIARDFGNSARPAKFRVSFKW